MPKNSVPILKLSDAILKPSDAILKASSAMLKDSVLMHYSLSTILKASSTTDGDPPTTLKRGLSDNFARFPLFLGVSSQTKLITYISPNSLSTFST